MGIWSRLGKGMLAVAAAATVFAGAAFAAEKKELTVYTALENEQINKYLASFREKYPDIEIKIVRDSTGIVTAKLLAEGEKTPADVVWGTAASSLLVLEDRGMIEPYAPKGLERVEPMLKDTANPPAWVGIDAWETAIIYNTAEASRVQGPDNHEQPELLGHGLPRRDGPHPPHGRGRGVQVHGPASQQHRDVHALRLGPR